MRLNSEAALAQAVRAARKDAGLSQQEVADRAGMSRVWVARLEGGEANVTLDSLLRVASVVGMELDATWDPTRVTEAKLPRKRRPQRKPSAAAKSKPGKTSEEGETDRRLLSPPESGSEKRPDTTGPSGQKGPTAVDLLDVLARVTKQ